MFLKNRRFFQIAMCRFTKMVTNEHVALAEQAYQH